MKSKLIPVVLSLFLSVSVRAQMIETEQLGSLSVMEQAQVLEFVQNIEEKLPSELKASIAYRKIRLKFTDFSSGVQSNQLLPMDCRFQEDPGNILEVPGRSSLKDKRQKLSQVKEVGDDEIEIKLSRFLIPAIVAGEAQSKRFPCGHKSTFKMAQAALVHGMAHVHTMSQGRMDLAKRKLRDDLKLFSQSSTECTRSVPSGPVSKDSQFLNMVGFASSSIFDGGLNLGLGGLEAKNQVDYRSPDPFEYENPEEAFAVNLEYFLLDPEYACRRPRHYRYLKKRFAHRPFVSIPCEVNTVAVVKTSNGPSNYLEPRDLDPKRVYQVHSVLADQGPSLISFFGHKMDRLVMCAPRRTQVDEECLGDAKDSVVLSFRGNPGEKEPGIWKGLQSKFPMQLYLMGLNDIRREYNEYENRNIQSLPYLLTQEQKEDYVYGALETLWYVGRYKLVSGNCATESSDLLKGAVPTPEVQSLSSVTPTYLQEEMIEKGIVDAKVIQNAPPEKLRNYVLESKKRQQVDAFLDIRKISLEAGEPIYYGDQDYWTKYTSTEERRQSFEAIKKALENTDPEKAARVAEDFFIVENRTSFSTEGYFFKEARGLIQDLELGEKPEIPKGVDSVQAIVLGKEIIALKKQLNDQYQVTPGYGIPLKNEVSLPDQATRTALLNEIQKKTSALAKLYEVVHPDEYAVTAAREYYWNQRLILKAKARKKSGSTVLPAPSQLQ